METLKTLKLTARRSRKNTSIDETSSVGKGGHIKVPVNEDYLFDVDVETFGSLRRPTGLVPFTTFGGVAGFTRKALR